MPRFIAFLRAVNVGGRVVKMDRLRDIFTKLGFTGVETFIASGNVIFETRSRGEAALRKSIERALEAELGLEVPVFLRTDAEVARIAAHEPLDAARRKAAVATCVGMLEREPDAAGLARLMALQGELDAFEVRGRECWWLCRAGQSDSKFSNVALEKALGMRSTLRSVTTMIKLAAKYPSR